MTKLIRYATLVGLTHGISLYFFMFLSSRFGADTVASIGLLESSLYLTTGIVSFGILQLAAREVVSGEAIHAVARRYQSLRFAIGLMVGAVGLVAYLITGQSKWIMFILAPVVALNVDYLLYAVGRPQVAGIVALVRQGGPYLAMMLAIVVGFKKIDFCFITVTLIGFLLAGMLSAYALKIRYLYLPSFNLANKIKPVLTVGISDFTYNSMRSSLPLVSGIFFQGEEVLVVYGFFKLMMVFIGARRLLVQFFYSRLVDPHLAKNVDWLVRGGAITLFFICVVMRRELSTAYFGKTLTDPNGTIIVVYAAVLLIMSTYTTAVVRLIQFHCEDFFMKSILLTGILFLLSCTVGMVFGMSSLTFICLFGMYELIVSIFANVKTKNFIIN
ncbi:MAG: hypothetical protein HGB26_03930 [Desulfobulbaceae bacterium]|nr:hypothetical protein [Desulfobulbaceae bacterium]